MEIDQVKGTEIRQPNVTEPKKLDSQWRRIKFQGAGGTQKKYILRKEVLHHNQQIWELGNDLC